jgi:hypothetical protein
VLLKAKTPSLENLERCLLLRVLFLDLLFFFLRLGVRRRRRERTITFPFELACGLCASFNTRGPLVPASPDQDSRIVISRHQQRPEEEDEEQEPGEARDIVRLGLVIRIGS